LGLTVMRRRGGKTMLKNGSQHTAAAVAAIFITMAFASGPSLAQEWTAFGIRKGGFIFDVPPGFSLDQLAEDSQAAAFLGPRGANLVVRGEHLSDTSFKQYVEAMIADDEGKGWQVTYRRLTNSWASYSGIRGGMIRYVRAILPCDDRIAIFQMDYHQSEKLTYDPVVVRMVKSLDPEGC
jgi:hypothetical protein